MFGYVQPDKSNILGKDVVLYKALYCGICKSLGKNYGCFARLTTSYDMTFLSALLHNYLDTDVKIVDKHCALHWFKKHKEVEEDEITKKLSALSVLMAYYKIIDDIVDEHSNSKKFMRKCLKKAYGKVSKEYEKADKIINYEYTRLSAYEKQYMRSIDRVSDCFGMMLLKLTRYVLGDKTSEGIEKMCYSLGKWVYLIDAIDDLEKDFKKRTFNPFLVYFGDYRDRDSFIAKHREDIEFIINTTINQLRLDYNTISFHFNKDLIDNIIENGLIKKTKEVLEGKNEKSVSSAKLKWECYRRRNKQNVLRT